MAIMTGIGMGIENKSWGVILLLFFLPIHLALGLILDYSHKRHYRKNGWLTLTADSIIIQNKKQERTELKLSEIEELILSKSAISGSDLKPYLKKGKDYDQIPFDKWTSLEIEFKCRNSKITKCYISNRTDWNSRNNFNSHYAAIKRLVQINNLNFREIKHYK